MHPPILKVNSFNPRAYVRRDYRHQLSCTQILSFNPRAYVRRDDHTLTLSSGSWVSIHAPT